MKSIYSKMIALLLVVCTFAFFDSKYHILDKFGDDDIISQEEMISQIGGVSETYTVRKISYGVGVERIFPVHSPMVAKIEVTRHGKVRRAKLHYIRSLSAKAARIKERR